MPQVRKITKEDLEEMGVYLSIMDTGAVVYKSTENNTIVTRINPTVLYEAPSLGGRASHKKAKEDEVKVLLEELEIPSDDPRAVFLANQALHSKQGGDALRAFRELLNTFRPEAVPPVHVHRVYMSDRSYHDLVNRATDADYLPDAWLSGPRDIIPEVEIEDLTDHGMPLNSDTIIEEELKVEWDGEPENKEPEDNDKPKE